MSPNRVASLFSHPAWAGLTIVASLTMTACSTSSNTAAPSSSEAAPAASPGKGVQSIARLEATKGSQVTGTVQFFPQPDGSVRVRGRVEGLAPNTEHGFHVHEKGDCSSGDGLSAGGTSTRDSRHMANSATARPITPAICLAWMLIPKVWQLSIL